jgi:hypothetical protein
MTSFSSTFSFAVDHPAPAKLFLLLLPLCVFWGQFHKPIAHPDFLATLNDLGNLNSRNISMVVVWWQWPTRCGGARTQALENGLENYPERI